MSKCDFKAATITVNGYATVTNCKFGTVNVGKDNNDYRFITGGSDSVIKTIDLNGACESGSLFIKDECSIDTVNVTGNGNTADSSEIDIQGWLYDTSGEITNVNVYGNSKHVILGGVSVGTLKTINTSASNNIEVISASYNTLLVYGTKNHVDLVLDSNNKGSNTWASGNNEVYIWGGTYGTVKATSAVQVKEDVSEVYIDTLDVINTPTIIAGHIGTFKQRDSKGTYIHDFSVKLADKASDYNFHCEGDVSVAVKSDGNMTLTALPLEDGTKCSGWYTADNAGGLKLSGSATNYVAAGSSGGIYAYYGTAQEKPLWIIDPTQKKNASSNSINSIHFDLKRDFSDLSDLTITETGERMQS
jgi:hypothetical protein